MTEQKTYVRKHWSPTDKRPGAAELNRIEDGIELAHLRADKLEEGGRSSETIDLLTAKYREIEYLPANAKVAEVVEAFNKVLSLLRDDENTAEKQ